MIRFFPSPFSWLLGSGLGVMALYGATRFARGVGRNAKRDCFTLDGEAQAIRAQIPMQEETIALEDIDYFVFWTRERLSETERDTRCVTQRGREVVLHFTQDEQLACLLGYLCKKPAWKRDADGTLTRLSLPESLQSLLRPSADEAVQEAQDLLRASSGQSKPTAPSELLRPAETSLEATPPVTSNAVSYPEL